MKKIILLLVFLLIPFQSSAKVPNIEYVRQTTIKAVCGVDVELYGCINYQKKRILVWWKIQSDKKLEKKVIAHEIGHWLTRDWTREVYLKKLGFADTNENDVITLSEKTADMYEDYKTIGIKDKKAIKAFQALEKLNR